MKNDWKDLMSNQGTKCTFCGKPIRGTVVKNAKTGNCYCSRDCFEDDCLN